MESPPHVQPRSHQPRRYGQFCPVSMAAEILAERWTLLVIRELLMGSSRFNDLHRGVPLMSTSLLSQRLKELEAAGLVERRHQKNERHSSYHPTDACQQLLPIIQAIGFWGMRFVRGGFDEHNLDPSLLLWDIRRNVRAEHLPPGKVVIHFTFPDQSEARRDRWLVKEADEDVPDVCHDDPGFDVDLTITASLRDLTRVWLGELDLSHSLRSGIVTLEGAAAYRMSIYDWIGLSVFAKRVA